MFSPPIDPPKPAIPTVPTAATRQTEASDAKMALRNHEEQPGKKKDQDDKDKASPFGAIDDDMVLSVQALIDFLENFIRTQRETSTSTGRTSDPETPINPDAQISDKPSPQTAYAANAYAHAASVRVPHTPPTTMHTDTPNTDDEATGPELRRAMGLVAKLRALDARGVPGIHLAPGADFLASLEDAINRA